VIIDRLGTVSLDGQLLLQTVQDTNSRCFSFVSVFNCRRLPHVSLEESPKEAKPSHSLDLSDTDTECAVTAVS